MLAVILLGPVYLIPATGLAALDCSNPATAQAQIQCGANDASGNTSGNDGSTLDKTIKTIVNVLSIIAGVIAVIMIIIGGLRYITSGGKQESISSAKNTILYSIIGLVVVALAQVVVRFVLHSVTK
jgi:hypothetical protein